MKKKIKKIESSGQIKNELWIQIDSRIREIEFTLGLLKATLNDLRKNE